VRAPLARDLTHRVAGRWLQARLPARTIRLRLTLVYGALFLVSGFALLTFTYLLVQHQYTGKFFQASASTVVFGVQTGGSDVTAVGAGKQPAVGAGKQPAVVTSRQEVGAGTPDPSLSSVPTPEQVIAASQAQSAASLHKLLIDSAIALAVMSVLSVWLGWVIAGRALRPLRTITNAAREISASNLHRRLALEGPDDELKQLGTTFDGLLERLEGAFDAQRRFVANASHELRTPLTFERTLLEVALSDPDADQESLRRTCEQVLAVGEQQERLIEALLTLSRSQRGLDQHEPVDIAAIAGAAADALDHDGIRLATDLRPANTSGDPRLVERLVANLVGNAVRHNVPGGHLTVDTWTHNGHAVLTVANTGRRIASDDVPRLLRPFERLDRDRSSEKAGLGLGLSIVDAIAAAHSAGLQVRALRDGGLEVEVAFPAAAAPGGSSARYEIAPH
jgi:signal transduction histidine kinase